MVSNSLSCVLQLHKWVFFVFDVYLIRLCEPFKALSVCSILVRGNGTGCLLVLGAGTGLYPSRNSNGGGIIFSS